MPASFELPVRTVSEANSHQHWRVRHRRASMQRQAAFLMAASAMPGQTLARPLRVLLTRIAPRDLDDDNLPVSMKHIRDGIADALGVDDRDPRITWRYAQARGARGEYAVRVDIALETLEPREPRRRFALRAPPAA